MNRLKTTTRRGKVFLSPFVYTPKQIHRLIRSLTKWHQNEETGLPTFERIEVSKWPAGAVYNPDWATASILHKLPRIEEAWERREE